jgi:hypothetical protein
MTDALFDTLALIILQAGIILLAISLLPSQRL